MKERREGGRKEGRDSQKGREVSAQGRAGDRLVLAIIMPPAPSLQSATRISWAQWSLATR